MRTRQLYSVECKESSYNYQHYNTVSKPQPSGRGINKKRTNEKALLPRAFDPLDINTKNNSKCKGYRQKQKRNRKRDGESKCGCRRAN